MAQPKKYKAEIVSISKPIDNIHTVELKSLSGKFKFDPGQFLHFALDEYDPSSGWPESRCFSIQTSPISENIKFTFSVKGSFTSRMATYLKPGIVVDLKLPYGSLFQKSTSKNRTVFIAGGTGITPFLSLFNDPIFKEYSVPKLYFGIRDEKYNIYNEYLNMAKLINPRLEIIIRFQDKSGFLDIDQILNENSIDPTYFISGPQAMISTFKLRLVTLGVSRSNVITDDWE